MLTQLLAARHPAFIVVLVLAFVLVALLLACVGFNKKWLRGRWAHRLLRVPMQVLVLATALLLAGLPFVRTSSDKVPALLVLPCMLAMAAAMLSVVYALVCLGVAATTRGQATVSWPKFMRWTVGKLIKHPYAVVAVTVAAAVFAWAIGDGAPTTTSTIHNKTKISRVWCRACIPAFVVLMICLLIAATIK